MTAGLVRSPPSTSSSTTGALLDCRINSSAYQPATPTSGTARRVRIQIQTPRPRDRDDGQHTPLRQHHRSSVEYADRDAQPAHARLPLARAANVGTSAFLARDAIHHRECSHDVVAAAVRSRFRHGVAAVAAAVADGVRVCVDARRDGHGRGRVV
ncbi:hypothetical protein BKA80DRAFT_284536, partial [Phyllosticta citrichinensis]